jgi:hypothetical protein
MPPRSFAPMRRISASSHGLGHAAFPAPPWLLNGAAPADSVEVCLEHDKGTQNSQHPKGA